MAERHAAQLTELAELGMGLARGLAARAEAAQDDAAAERLSLAFHRVSRSVRQTLALEAKLARDRHLLADQERAARRRATAERRNHVRTAVNRLIWIEAEGLEDEDGENETALAFLSALEPSLNEAELSPDFLAAPVETLVARIRADLGLAANDAGLAWGSAPPADDPPRSTAAPPSG